MRARRQDTTSFGKPGNFSGNIDDWPSWELKFKSWFGEKPCSTGPEEKATSPITTIEFVQRFLTIQQLRVLLISLRDSGSEALAVVKNSHRSFLGGG